jgi:hypothetical protein
MQGAAETYRTQAFAMFNQRQRPWSAMAVRAAIRHESRSAIAYADRAWACYTALAQSEVRLHISATDDSIAL